MIEVIKKLKEYAEIVTSTMGPAGWKVVFKEDVVIGKHILPAGTFTRDGVTVVSALMERHKDLASKILWDACQSTVSKVGDGTTTCALFLSILMDADLSIRAACEKACEEIDKLRVTPTKEQLINVAITSANNDTELGTIIGELIWTLGEDAHIESGFGPKTKVEIKKGFTLEGGTVPHLLDKGRKTLLNPNVIIIQDHIKNFGEVEPIFNLQRALNKDAIQPVYQGGKIVGYNKIAEPTPLVVISSTIEEDALGVIINNQMYGIYVAGVVEKDLEMMMDLADILKCKCVLTATATKTGQGVNKKLDLHPADAGSCEKIELTPKAAVITFHDYVPREDMPSERKAKFTKGIGVITIGGSSRAEQLGINFRVEDCVLSTQSAFKGIVPGGGVTTTKLSGQFFGVFLEALLAPYSKIRENGAFEESEVWDSAEVLKTALRTATSVACEIIQTKNVV